MKKEEAEKYLNQEVYLVVSNNFRFKGIIKCVNEDTLIILDKFKKEVLIRLNDIVILTPFVNG